MSIPNFRMSPCRCHCVARGNRVHFIVVSVSGSHSRAKATANGKACLIRFKDDMSRRCEKVYESLLHRSV
jgi:hypothetical protein